ncbi:MAG: UDP-N-acetylglucosamine--N-acetylmuramyl-(pentapeptide) pyrophosphoryl-undecaprenol N-acetylglucosamine transferase [Anaerolineales bacterium]|nr:UDP-N-acetylglucosamine--N-acetylmuramyl-(pentapeptide) pyrophosphoryl-undecaprenol N-acetylglucosamine transferase [Anaerolineales bacterium]
MYPALAVLQALNDLNRSGKTADAVLWVGGEDGMEGELISRQDIAYQSIPAAGLHGVGIKRLPANLLKLVQGYLKARKIIREFQPEVLFFTGGYLAVPAAFAGRSIPSLVFIPDIEPGLAIKTISNLAARVAVSVDQSRTYLPPGKPVIVSGYPVRSNLLNWTREEAFQTLDLSAASPVLLVFGGSKGARSINQALSKILPKLLQEMQVVHITGKLDWDEMAANRDKLTKAEQKKYRIYPFLHEQMGAALRCADLVVSRSGASILGEYPLFELPAILIPYPYAWRYQKTNAKHLVDQGAAYVIKDGELSEKLLPTVMDLIRNRGELDFMKSAMKKLARPQAAETIARELIKLVGNPGGGTPL